jgi:hypothetical protein
MVTSRTRCNIVFPNVTNQQQRLQEENDNFLSFLNDNNYIDKKWGIFSLLVQKKLDFSPFFFPILRIFAHGLPFIL